MDRSEQINELAAALAKAQGAYGKVNKTKEAHVRSPRGDYSYRYADLADIWEAIRPALSGNGLAIVQVSMPAPPGEIAIETMLMHTSGQWLAATMAMPADMSRPQFIGSIQTYLRRYSISAIAGIVAEDEDDGNAATVQEQERNRDRARTAPRREPDRRTGRPNGAGPPKRVVRPVPAEPETAPVPEAYGAWVLRAATKIGISEYQLNNHLYKWAHAQGWLGDGEPDPGKVSNADKFGILTPLFSLDSEAFRAEARAYQKDLADEIETTEAGSRG